MRFVFCRGNLFPLPSFALLISSFVTDWRIKTLTQSGQNTPLGRGQPTAVLGFTLNWQNLPKCGLWLAYVEGWCDFACHPSAANCPRLEGDIRTVGIRLVDALFAGCPIDCAVESGGL